MRAALLVTLALLGAGCGDPGRARVVRLSDNKELTNYRIQAVRGARDGDRLHAAVTFAAGASSLVLDLDFLIGVPTHLSAGAWRLTGDGGAQAGTVAERSVTFLGGQSGPPSIGGSFDLLSGTPLYRVYVPVTELK